MIKHNSSIVDIMYNPVSWVDNSYFDIKIKNISVQEKAIINDLLIQSFNFKPFVIDELSRLDKKMLSNWYYLKEIFYLMACYRFRTYLLSGNNFRFLPHYIKSFLLTINLNKLTLKMRIINQFDKTHLLNQAYQEMICFSEFFSEPVKQRLHYLFPNESKVIKTVDFSPNFLFLRVVSDYVKSKK